MFQHKRKNDIDYPPHHTPLILNSIYSIYQHLILDLDLQNHHFGDIGQDVSSLRVNSSLSAQQFYHFLC